MPANPIHVTALSQLRHSDFRRHDPLITRTDNTPPQAGSRPISAVNLICLTLANPFVNKSVTFSSVGTYETITVPSETLSQIKRT